MFSKRKVAKGAKSKNVNFEIPISSTNEDECVPGFYLGSTGSMNHLYNNPLPWHSSKDSTSFSHEEIDKIITPSDRFENLLVDNFQEKTPEVFDPIDTHHFDEDDYRNHRHRIYPHMHQPLKSMEPRVLRKIKEKIRENKSLQLRAATAGVPTSVPQLLASSSDSRVVFNPQDEGDPATERVLSLIFTENKPETIADVKDHITAKLPAKSAPILRCKTNRKRKKRKKRIKKQEPFHPTLGKVSEESNSPMLSGNEELNRLDNDDDDDYDEEFEDNLATESGGLILEELYSAVYTDNQPNSEHFMDIDQQQTVLSTDNIIEHPIKHKKLSFLEEISSSDSPVGFLDMTFRSSYTRNHSLPSCINTTVDSQNSPSRTGDDVVRQTGSKSTNDLQRQMLLMMPTTQIVPEEDEEEHTEIHSDEHEHNLHIANTNELVAHHRVSSITHQTNLLDDSTDSASTVCSNQPPHVSSSMTRLSFNEPPYSPKPMSCNFQIGSTDSVILPLNEQVNRQASPISSRSNSSGTTTSIHGVLSTPDKLRLTQHPHHNHHHHHHHHHHKEHYNKRDLEKRTFSGQDMRSLWQTNDLEELDEFQSSMLGDAIIDDMKSHRCYDMPALNRTRFRNRYLHSHSKNIIQRSRSVTHTHTPVLTDKSNPEDANNCETCIAENYHLAPYTKSQEDLIFQTNVSHTDTKYNEFSNDELLPLFVEMDMLKQCRYWREVSRWIRYEQVYNEFSDTFGKAHSSPLKFTAFTQFRVQMEDALFLPNVEASNLTEAIAILTEELLVAQLFTEPRQSSFVKEAFKLRHLHAGDKIVIDLHEDFNSYISAIHSDNVIYNFTDAQPQPSLTKTSQLQPRHGSSFTAATAPSTKQSIQHGSNPHIQGDNNEYIRPVNTSPSNLNNDSSTHIKLHGVQYSLDQGTNSLHASHGKSKFVNALKNTIPIKLHHKHQHKSDLEGHLPHNTEAVSVHVGDMLSLQKPFLAILRFKKPLKSENITEVNVPIKFLIVCLGPPIKLQYEEVGRVISTMMINSEFRKMMYRATDKYEIINGLYKYLDTCFVLSFADKHSARNMHTMVDHISDFMRTPLNSSVYKKHSRETFESAYQRPSDRLHSVELEETARITKHEEGIKNSASVNWADEQKPLIIKQKYSKNSLDSEEINKINDVRGQEKSLKLRTIVSKSEEFTESKYSPDVKQDSFKIYLTVEEDEDVPCYKKYSPFDCFIRFWYFLFRLLRLDLMMYHRRVVSDFLDAFQKDNIVIVLCGLLYLYFVCLSPALTFGALLNELVSEKFTVKTVLASNGCLLMVFALLSGNPMIVIGISGPMFLMESIIGRMANTFEIEITTYRFLVSLYVVSLGLLSLAVNITWIMQKVRRSVEESFNAFIGMYYMFKAIVTICKIFTIPKPNIPNNLINVTDILDIVPTKNDYIYQNKIAIGFASLVLAYTMYQICLALNSVKRGRFFTRKFRKIVDYFNVAIGILILSLINVMIVKLIGVSLPTLKADSTDDEWIKPPQFHQIFYIDPTANIIAFFLAFALISLAFTETAIAGISVTKAERKLVKPSLFALDQFVVLCILPIISGCLGWPFLCGAAVRSTSYVISMTKWDSVVVPGVRHKIIGVVEQRVTLLIVGALVLATILVGDILKYIPVSAMLGMFLYMGVTAIRDLVVTRRFITMFKRAKHWKDHDYLKDIPPKVLRTFEACQCSLILLMFFMNCTTEFLGITWTTFLIPVILLFYAFIREIILTRINFFSPHLDKMDPRHIIHIAALCPVSVDKFYNKSYHNQRRHPSPSSASLGGGGSIGQNNIPPSGLVGAGSSSGLLQSSGSGAGSGKYDHGSIFKQERSPDNTSILLTRRPNDINSNELSISSAGLFGVRDPNSNDTVSLSDSSSTQSSSESDSDEKTVNHL